MNRTLVLRRALPRLTLYTGGPECLLCEEAKEVLEAVKPDAPFELETVNIHDKDKHEVKKWRRLYQYDIPVLHLAGQQIMKHRFDKAKLVEMLRAG